jgi:signal transduction histidine kinase/pSer/pThr/pTyr-binding forkhead associated (FHA) protein
MTEIIATSLRPSSAEAGSTILLRPKQLTTGLLPEYVLDHFPAAIGRHPTNDIELPFDAVSRYHARIEWQHGRPYVIDLRSSNGTFVNGKRVQQGPLADQDALAFGTIDFTVVLPDEDQAAPTVKSPSDTTSVQFMAQDDNVETVYHAEMPEQGVGVLDEEITDTRQLKEAKQQLRCFYRLHEILNSTTEEEKMLRRTIDLLFDVLPVDRGVILTRDEHDASMFRPIAIRTQRPVAGEKIGISKTILQRCLKEKVAVLTRDAAHDERFKQSESVMAHRLRSVMCVPIISAHTIFGFIHLDTTDAVRSFTEEDLTFLANVGVEIALHLHNLRMLHDRIATERMTAIGQTITGLAHNLKNILVLSQGGIEMMEKNLRKKDYDQLEETWGLARRGLDRIHRLVEEMLDYTRARTFERRRVAVNDMIEELRQTYAGELDKRGVECLLVLDPEVPPLMLDADGLEKALVNLLVNALDACEQGRGRVTIRSRLSADGALILQVEDNAGGIPAEIIPRIFVPFFTTKGSKGSGLGLSMTRKFIEDMGGRIDVHSTATEGTCFTITLAVQPSAPKSASPAATQKLKKKDEG